MNISEASRNERRRIRRLIAPHLREFRKARAFTHGNWCVCMSCKLARAIDAATRAPKKARTK